MIEKKQSEYNCIINEKKEVCINTFSEKNKKEINIIFEKNTQTEVLNLVINQLIEEYVQNYIKL